MVPSTSQQKGNCEKNRDGFRHEIVLLELSAASFRCWGQARLATFEIEICLESFQRPSLADAAAHSGGDCEEFAQLLLTSSLLRYSLRIRSYTRLAARRDRPKKRPESLEFRGYRAVGA